MICPICGKGELHQEVSPLTVELADGGEVTVEGVERDICDFCKEPVFDQETCKKIEKVCTKKKFPRIWRG
jgi:YgiT-type zinc finger domain-containing protein